ncbi:MAG TPA: DMT family transporter [Alphaproteobacteria bacterium]|nr:DMT family transporter [Alphaproteobacteria bacterium]
MSAVATATPPNRRLRALFLMLAAGLVWSTGGLLVRSVSIIDGWEIVFWRSLFMVLFMASVLAAWHGRRAPRVVRSIGPAGVLAGIFLSLTFFFFILSVTRTTVANTLVIMSIAPFAAAIFARLFIGEMVPPRTWFAMAIAFSGVAIMFANSLTVGDWLGNLLALGVPLAYASNITMLRRFGGAVDMAPTVMIAGLFSIVVALPMGWPFEATWRDIFVLAIMGVVQLGIGCLLMTLATRHLRAAEIGLITLLETILGPIWVWLGIGERPTDPALAGASIVVGALIANELFGFIRKRP